MDGNNMNGNGMNNQSYNYGTADCSQPNAMADSYAYYNQGNYADAAAPVKKGEGLGIAAMILGIAALLLAISSCCLPFVAILGAICGLISIILGIVAIAQNKGRGMGITGLVMSIISVPVAIIAIIFSVIMGTTLGVAFLGLGAAEVYGDDYYDSYDFYDYDYDTFDYYEF